MMLIEKKLIYVQKLWKKIKDYSNCKGKSEYAKIAKNIRKEILESYEKYQKKYKYKVVGDESYLEDKIEPQYVFQTNIPEDVPIENLRPALAYQEFNTLGLRKKSRSLRNVYKNVAQYQDTLKKICQRDIMRLARNRSNINELYAAESNWLFHMKAEVTNTMYGNTKR